MTITKPKPWTDEELGYVTDTLDMPRSKVAEELGRSVQAITHMRRVARSGWERQNAAWAIEEDVILSENAGTKTASEITNLLPGRTQKAVQNRLHQLGIKLGPHQARHPHYVGHRPLLAKTCRGCGFLLPAKWFVFQKTQKSWASWCRSCTNCLQPEYKSRPESKEKARRYSKYNEKAQAISLETATRRGEPYTEADHEIMSDHSLPILTKAVALGRTYNAIRSQVSLHGYLSHRAAGDPEKDRWLIDNPNAARIEEITADLNRTNQATLIRPDFEWDD